MNCQGANGAKSKPFQRRSPSEIDSTLYHIMPSLFATDYLWGIKIASARRGSPERSPLAELGQRLRNAIWKVSVRNESANSGRMVGNRDVKWRLQLQHA